MPWWAYYLNFQNLKNNISSVRGTSANVLITLRSVSEYDFKMLKHGRLSMVKKVLVIKTKLLYLDELTILILNPSECDWYHSANCSYIWKIIVWIFKIKIVSSSRQSTFVFIKRTFLPMIIYHAWAFVSRWPNAFRVCSKPQRGLLVRLKNYCLNFKNYDSKLIKAKHFCFYQAHFFYYW